MPKLLIAGIGNIFRGDDAFGCEVVRVLLNRREIALQEDAISLRSPLVGEGGESSSRVGGEALNISASFPPTRHFVATSPTRGEVKNETDSVRVKDFGIRGFDLACALVDGYDGAILIDAVSRGRPPGTLYLIEPELSEGVAAVDPHGLTPDHVLRLAMSLGELPPWLRLIGCEPETLGSEDEGAMGLSDTVQAVVEEAARIAEEIAREFLACPVRNPSPESSGVTS
jgi:hydrogenase maturation protease